MQTRLGTTAHAPQGSSYAVFPAGRRSPFFGAFCGAGLDFCAAAVAAAGAAAAAAPGAAGIVGVAAAAAAAAAAAGEITVQRIERALRPAQSQPPRGSLL